MSITFEGVSYSYKGEPRAKKTNRFRKATPQENTQKWGETPDHYWALKNVSFRIEDGDFVGIAGHTGSGKSTLVRHMNGLLQPTRGRVLVNGIDISDKKEAAKSRKSVGVVFQYPEHQLFADTVYNDVAFGPKNMGLSEDEIDERVHEALAAVDLNDDTIINASPFELSGGQQRRCALAGVIAMRPNVLVCDEPVAGLDPLGREELFALITRLHENGFTVVIVSHDMDDLANYCKRVIILNEGEFFADGTPEEVFTQPQALRDIGLDVPFAQNIAYDLKNKKFKLPKTLYDIETLADDIAHNFSFDSELQDE